MTERVVIGDCTLYRGDCLDILPSLAAGSIDCIVTDPPFFAPATHYQSRANNKWQRKYADLSVLERWWRLVAIELKRVCKPSAHVFVFCNAESYAPFYPAMYDRWGRVGNLVWDKCHFGMGQPFRRQHELIIHAHDSGAYDPPGPKNKSDVLKHRPVPPASRTHPVEKPGDLLRALVEAGCPEGGVVLDAFAGGGSLGIAAISSGRRAILVDRDADYHGDIQRRIEAIYHQGNLLAEAAA